MSERPELNFQRVKSTKPEAGEEGWIWVVLDGQRRPLLTTTYKTLFRDDEGVTELDDANEIDLGAAISDAYIAQDDADNKTYFVAENRKWFITSQEAIDKYRFDKDQARRVSTDELASLSDAGEVS